MEAGENNEFKHIGVEKKKILSSESLVDKIMEDNKLTSKDLKYLRELKKRIDSENVEGTENNKKSVEKITQSTKEKLKNFLENVIQDSFLFDRVMAINNILDFKAFIIGLKILGFNPINKKTGEVYSWKDFDNSKNYNDNPTSDNPLTRFIGANQVNIEDGYLATYKDLEFQRPLLTKDQLNGFTINTQVDYEYLGHSLKELGYDVSEFLDSNTKLLGFNKNIKGDKVKLKGDTVYLGNTKIELINPVLEKPTAKKVLEKVVESKEEEPLIELNFSDSIKRVEARRPTKSWKERDLKIIQKDLGITKFASITRKQMVDTLSDNSKLKAYSEKEAKNPDGMKIVLMFQIALTKLGKGSKIEIIDGINGNQTKEAIVDFQKSYNNENNKKLDENGKVGPKTAQALIGELYK